MACSEIAMKFARWTFLIAGIYGILILTPHYFMEKRIGTDHPPAITHPEFFYGFVGIALAWQILFLIIAGDPVRYRMAMLAGVVEKFSFTIAAYVLSTQNRIAPPMAMGAGIDAVLGILFIISFLKTKNAGQKMAASAP
jgi:hypothetical protein